ncbi:hypothetical protein DHBDCA_p2846 [Dehalobacter sp. DCA]|nr:hypothetical protein DHBDCA_p2846 [Dehalobacter sp. DCA]
MKSCCRKSGRIEKDTVSLFSQMEDVNLKASFSKIESAAERMIKPVLLRIY